MSITDLRRLAQGDADASCPMGPLHELVPRVPFTRWIVPTVGEPITHHVSKSALNILGALLWEWEVDEDLQDPSEPICCSKETSPAPPVH